MSITTVSKTDYSNLTEYGTLKKTLIGHKSAVTTLITLLNGDLVSGSFSNTINIWNPNDGSLRRTLISKKYTVALTRLSNGGLVSGSYDSTFKIWNPNDGTLKRTLPRDPIWISALTKLSNGDLVNSELSDQNFRMNIWTTENYNFN